MAFKTLLLAIFSFSTLVLQAQSYDFSVTTGSYENLTSSTSLNNGLIWDDPEYVVPIGFDFQFFDNSYNQFSFGGYGGELVFEEVGGGIHPLLAPYAPDLIDRGYYSTSASDISYQLDGNVGSRIFKLEWNNAGFYEELYDDYTSTDYVNFQLWLYEGTNEIEIHYGPKYISRPDLCFDGETGAPIGLFSRLDFSDDALTGEHLALFGNPSSPTVKTTADFAYVDFLSDTIPNGTIYNFAFDPGVGTKDVTAVQWGFTIQPNPANDYLELVTANKDLEIQSVSVVNATGQTIKEYDFGSGTIDISGLNSGIYFVQLNSKKGIATHKFVKL